MKKHLPQLRTMTWASLPIAFSIMANTVVTTVDIIMVGYLGEIELAAIGIAGAIWQVLVMACIGVGTMSSALLSQAIAQNDQQHIQNTVYGIIATGLIMALSCSLLLAQPTILLSLLGQDPAIIPLADEFLQSRRWFTTAVCLAAIFRGFIGSMGLQKYLLGTALYVLITNTFLNYVLIFGNFGAPAMGVGGAAMASNIVDLSSAIIMYIVITRQNATVSLKIFSGLFDTPYSVIKHTFRVSIPVSLAMGTEMLFWAGITVIAGIISVQALAAHQMTMSIAYVIIPPYIAFSTMITIHAGQSAGIKDTNGLNSLIRIGILFATLYASLCMILVTTIVPIIVPHIFNLSDSIMKTGLSGMVILIITQWGYGLFLSKSNILKGVNDTTSILIISMISFVLVGLSAGYILSQYYGIIGLWWGMVVATLTVTLMCYIRFRIIRNDTNRLYKHVRYADEK